MGQIKNIHRKEADLFLVIGIIAVAIIIYACVRLFSPAGAFAVITINGQETARFPLGKDTTYRIEGYEGGYNDLCISGGEAYLADADCPDKLCVSQGHIVQSGELIICLPHRVAIYIEEPDSASKSAPTNDTEESGVDTIAK